MPVGVGRVGVYVLGRWSALQLFGYLHKAQCLITNKHWFNQGSKYCWMDRLELLSFWWEGFGHVGVSLCVGEIRDLWLSCLFLEEGMRSFNRGRKGSLCEEIHYYFENDLLAVEMKWCGEIHGQRIIVYL